MNRDLLEQRIIGASDAPVIMKLFPYGKTPYQLWEEKVNNKESTSNAAMEYGNRMEEPARQWFEKELGIALFGDRPIKHPDHEFMTATLDGIDMDGTTILEIKNTNEEYFEMSKQGKYPEHFYCQIQHQLEIANKLYGIKKGYLGTRHKGDHALVEIEYSEDYCNPMIHEESTFYYENILKKKEPELTEKDWVNMKENDQWEIIASEWKHANNMIKEYEKQEKTYRELLLTLANHRNAEGHGIKITKSVCKGSVDYSKVPELKGIDLEIYRKDSIQKWRITPLEK